MDTLLPSVLVTVRHLLQLELFEGERKCETTMELQLEGSLRLMVIVLFIAMAMIKL